MYWHKFDKRSDRIDQRAMPIGSLHIRAWRMRNGRWRLFVVRVHPWTGWNIGGLWREIRRLEVSTIVWAFQYGIADGEMMRHWLDKWIVELGIAWCLWDVFIHSWAMSGGAGSMECMVEMSLGTCWVHHGLVLIVRNYY